MPEIKFGNIIIQPILKSLSDEKKVSVSVLRLDRMHPIVSGNKWFKLKYYLEEAVHLHSNRIQTFGGTYSNHLVATAYAAKAKGLPCRGFVRGENTGKPSPTLLQAKALGMELVFTNRQAYQNKAKIMKEWDEPGTYWIMEGGYGMMGAMGAADILKITETAEFSHIICAVGTGTMMAGLIKAAKLNQAVIGISVLKNHFQLQNEVAELLTSEEKEKTFSIIHDYHFGGYGKHPEELIGFMKEIWQNEYLPTDIVYTSKMMFAAKDLIQKNYFPPGSRLLLIHSGGLQGNRSLSAGRLPF